MVGGGQLARMTHAAAIALGQTLRVLAVSPDDPAAQVTPDVVIGAHTDLDALRKAAAGADALTFDHEHVPTELLEKLVADGVNVAPPPTALIHAQDKLVVSIWGGSWRDLVRDTVAKKFTQETGVPVEFITGGTIDRDRKSVV